MFFLPHTGAFVARRLLTVKAAHDLAAAGMSVVVLQVDYQGSKLPQFTVDELRQQQLAAAAAGLEVWWWAWVRPGPRTGKGRRPGGPDALHRRLAELVTPLGKPEAFIVNAEVGGGWPAGRADLRPHLEAARSADMPVVGLSSHGWLGGKWNVEGYDIGLPQIYKAVAVKPPFVWSCLESWREFGRIWPVLGCSETSDADEMRADLGCLESMAIPGAAWWTARYLVGGKLAAAATTRRIS
jgi:hypothetical protein